MPVYDYILNCKQLLLKHNINGESEIYLPATQFCNKLIYTTTGKFLVPQDPTKSRKSLRCFHNLNYLRVLDILNALRMCVGLFNSPLTPCTLSLSFFP